MLHLFSSKKFHFFVLFLGTAFSLWMMTTFKLHYDHSQILGKVHKLLSDGEWTHYGNRGTGVGYVPGTFLTAIAAGPMKLWYSPYAAMILIIISQALCTLLFYFPIRKIFGNLVAALFLILFWFSPWRVEQTELYNPAYLFLFAGVHFWTSYKLKDEKSFFNSLLHVFALGLCAQVHFSFVILAFCSLFLLIFRMVHVDWKGVSAGVLLTGLTLLPYFLSLSGQETQGIEIQTSSGFIPGKNLVLIYPVLKAILYWLRYSSLYFARHIFTEIHFSWIAFENLRTIVSSTFHILKWPIAIFTLLLSIKIQWSFLKSVWKELPLKRVINRTQLAPSPWVIHYGFYLFCGMLVSASLSPVEFNHWHLILCLPTAALLVSIGAAEIIELHKQWIWLIPAVVIYFFVYNTVITMGSKMHDIRNNYHQEVIKAYPMNPNQ